MSQPTLPLEFDLGGTLPPGLNRVANHTGRAEPLIPLTYPRERVSSVLESDLAQIGIHCLVGGAMVAIPTMCMAYSAFAVVRWLFRH